MTSTSTPVRKLKGPLSGPSMEQLLANWDGEHVVSAYDDTSGAWIFICIHSTILGPAGGGTRMKVYPSPGVGLEDCMRLSRAMTAKMAIAGLPFGGGKAVLAVPTIPKGEERRRLLLWYGEMIATLRGAFVTGPDMNTTSTDMDLVGRKAPRYVFARSLAHGGCGPTGPGTAVGVLHGIRASLAYAFGSPDVAGRSVLIQGVGEVGGPLAERLGRRGARVLIADVDQIRVRSLAQRIGAEVVGPDDVIGAECDVYSPCALGGVLSEETIPRLRCRVVAGSANNQLAAKDDAERLRRAGILYAPDYVINASGAIYGVGFEALGWSRDEMRRRLEAIGETLLRIYEESEAADSSTAQAAARLVQERLEQPWAGSTPGSVCVAEKANRKDQRLVEV